MDTGSFNKYTNYNDQAGVSSVVFGAGKSVLEVELNEVQEVSKKLLRNMVAKVCGDGITDINKVTYKDGVINIAPDCSIVVDGIIVNCTGLNKSVSSGTIYLQVWEEVVDHNATLKKEGNQDNAEVVVNYIKDNRVNEETTRRKVVKYTLAASIDDSRHNLLIATISSGKCEINVREINLTKLKANFDEAVADLDNEIATLEGTLRDLINTNSDNISALQENKVNKSDIDTSTSLDSANPISNKAITAFVNSSIATNTADFLGTYDSLSSLKNNATSAANNDYAFVKTIDEDGNTIYNRYKYSTSTKSWIFEYALNNSSFTAEQWAAINSGINSDKTAKIAKHDEDIESINADLQSAFNQISTHEHNYAGSSSKGGAATSANKLNTNAGSATKPVYFANGIPVACNYILAAACTKGVINNTAKGGLGWTADNGAGNVPTINTIAYWDGTYNGTTSNLAYCVKGAFGSACTYGATSSVTSGSTSLVTSGAVHSALGNYLAKSGGTMDADATITIPDATLSSDRKTTISADGVKMRTPSNAGWSMGSDFYNNDATTKLGGYRAYGTANALLYHYIGTDYNNPLFKFDTSGNATFKGSCTATSFSGNASSATKLATARTIDGVSFNGSAAIHHYGTCSTAAATAAKVVTLSGFSLVTGAKITVVFSNTNSADGVTLNVNGTGAKAVYYLGAAQTHRLLKLPANVGHEFVYNGTNWIYCGQQSYVSQSNSTASSDFRVLLSCTADDNQDQGSVYKSSKFTANPSTGLFKATTFSGSGASLTNLNASKLASGTVPIARIPTGTSSTTVALGNHTHTIDSALSTTSTNPVQNKIVTTKINATDAVVNNLANSLQDAFDKFDDYLPSADGVLVAEGGSNYGENQTVTIPISNLSNYNLLVVELYGATNNTSYPGSNLLTVLPVKTMSSHGATIKVGPFIGTATVSTSSSGVSVTAIKSLGYMNVGISGDNLLFQTHDTQSVFTYRIWAVS